MHATIKGSHICCIFTIYQALSWHFRPTFLWGILTAFPYYIIPFASLEEVRVFFTPKPLKVVRVTSEMWKADLDRLPDKQTDKERTGKTKGDELSGFFLAWDKKPDSLKERPGRFSPASRAPAARVAWWVQGPSGCRSCGPSRHPVLVQTDPTLN